MGRGRPALPPNNALPLAIIIHQARDDGVTIFDEDVFAGDAVEFAGAGVFAGLNVRIAFDAVGDVGFEENHRAVVNAGGHEVAAPDIAVAAESNAGGQ